MKITEEERKKWMASKGLAALKEAARGIRSQLFDGAAFEFTSEADRLCVIGREVNVQYWLVLESLAVVKVWVKGPDSQGIPHTRAVKAGTVSRFPAGQRNIEQTLARVIAENFQRFYASDQAVTDDRQVFLDAIERVRNVDYTGREGTLCLLAGYSDTNNALHTKVEWVKVLSNMNESGVRRGKKGLEMLLHQKGYRFWVSDFRTTSMTHSHRPIKIILTFKDETQRQSESL